MKWAGRAALVVLSILSVFALAEGLLRFVGAARFGLQTWHAGRLYRPDPELIYSLRPSARGRRVSAEFAEEVTINRVGLRSPEPLAPGTRPRVLVLGDSQTFGHGVGDEAPYPRRLQGLFEARGAAVEVVNAGMQGFSSDQSFKLFAKRLRGLEPDLVVFAHYWNDIPENITQALYLVAEDMLQELGGVQHVSETRTLDNHVARLRRKIELDPKNPTVVLTVPGVGYRLAPGQLEIT